MLYSLLPNNIIDLIKTVNFDIHPAVEDGYIWKGNLDGVYTASAGYKWLLSSKSHVQFPNASQSWNWIWDISGPEKIKLLIWLACHDALPTASLLFHIGMMTSPSCQRCGHSAETVMHCLRDCPKCIAKEIAPDYMVILAINNMASLILKTSEKPKNGATPSRLVSWKPPLEYDVVLNVDGSSFGNPGISGFGGLLRGTDGHWIAGFAGHIGISNNLHAELLGLQHGLLLAWDKGFRSLICYSDSMNVIQLVNSPLNVWNRFAPIIQSIKDLLGRDWLVLLAHTLREGNSCADFLAKMGAASTTSWSLLDVPPADLSPHLLADAAGVEFVRA